MTHFTKGCLCKVALAQRERILGSLRLKQTVAYH